MILQWQRRYIYVFIVNQKNAKILQIKNILTYFAKTNFR